MKKVARSISLKLICFLTVLWMPGVTAAATEIVERWYVLEMMGQRAGWMMERVDKNEERIITRSESVISVAQGANALTIEVSSSFTETPDGRPIAMDSTRKFGAMDVRQEFTFDATDVGVKTTQSGRTTESRTGRPEGEWLTPEAAKAYFKKRMEAGADSIVLRSIDAQSGLTPVSTKYTNFKKDQLRHQGAMIDVKWFDVEISTTPGVKSRECVDEAGNVLRSETTMGGLSVIMRLSTRDEARGKLSAPEIMMKMFVRPDLAINDPRHATRAVYKISARNELPDLPTTGTQRFERIDDKRATVTVTSNAIMQSSRPDPADLSAGAMIDGKDPEVVGAMRRALKGIEDAPAAERAEALRRFVFASLEKKLGVGFATASEVARTREGDCSEHGVFLAALLRASDIPARVAAGLIYADAFAGAKEIFGYHMWAQAWIEVDGVGRWVDLDATLPDSTPYDATHITLAVMSLKDEDLSTSMAAMAATLGTLNIEISSVEGASVREHR